MSKINLVRAAGVVALGLLMAVPVFAATPVPISVMVPAQACVSLPNSMTEGSMEATTPGVLALQDFLMQKGYLSAGHGTGAYGPLTVAAVKAYQHATILPETGLAGNLTRASIKAETCGAADTETDAAATTTPATTATSTKLTLIHLERPHDLARKTEGTWVLGFALPSSTTVTPLSYSATWGDETGSSTPAKEILTAVGTKQSVLSFTHAYAATGIYAPTFLVSAGDDSIRVSATVHVTD